MRALLVICLFLFATRTAESAIILSGKAYFQGQTDHSGIVVRFYRLQPTVGVDSATTAVDGSYSILDSAGFYAMHFSKPGYFGDSIVETPYYSNTTIANRILTLRTTRLNVPTQFPSIQKAITQAVDGDTVLVAPGVYQENLTWDSKNIIVTSNLLLTNDTSYIRRTTIDGDSKGSVVTIANVSSSNAILMGFTITNGVALTGGGVSCSNSSAQLKQLLITRNISNYCDLKGGTDITGGAGGGGLALIGCTSLVDSIVFENNQANFTGGGGTSSGGHALVVYQGSPSISNCRFSGTSDLSRYSTSVIQLIVSAAPVFRNCEISSNSTSSGLINLGADNDGGAHAIFDGMVIKNNITTGNAIGIWWGSSATFTNMVLAHNACAGGIKVFRSQLVLVNSTLADNVLTQTDFLPGASAVSADQNGGVSISIRNCIVTQNKGYACAIYNGSLGAITYKPDVVNSLFFDNSRGNFLDCGLYLGKNITVNFNGDSADAYGNIQANPCFVNSNAGNYHLADWSRAIGAGTSTGAPATDIDGIVRGNPPDIGAYENSRNTPIALPTPGVPLLAIPANNSVVIPVPILLKWHISTYAHFYRLQIFTDAGLSVKVFDTSTINDTFVNFTSALNATQYYWQVNASNTSGTSAWSSTSNFTTPTLLAPALISPLNSAANESLNPVLAWNSSSDAATYRIQFSTDSTFSTMLADDSTLAVTTKTINSLSTTTRYYWRVRAKNAGGVSAWSSLWNFITVPSMPGVPTLASPSNSASGQPLTTSLKWNAVTGATTYRIQLSTINVFTTTIVDDYAVSSALRVIGPLSTNTNYYWRVNAKNAGGTSVWSDTWSFTTVPPATGAPTLVLPSNGAATQPLNLTLLWAAVSGASSYRVQVSTSSTFAGTVVDDSTPTSTMKAIGPLSNNTSYYWRVNAKSAGGISAWSETWNLTTIAPSPDQVLLLIPTNASTITTDSVALIWYRSSPGIDKYCLEIFTDSVMNGRLSLDSTIVDTMQIRKSIPNKATYWWHVKAHNISGWGAPSTLNKFTINIPAVAVLPSKYTCALNGISKAGSSIVYSLPAASDVSIKLYSMQGKLVQIICSSYQQAGYYQANMNYSIISKGYYLLDFKAGNYSVRRRITNF